MEQLSLFPIEENSQGLDYKPKTHLAAPARNQHRVSTEVQEGSDPLLLSIWLRLTSTWFPERDDLRTFRVLWSTRRQKRTLASISLEVNRVLVARELNYPNHHQWLEPLLYHEMCHAYLHSEYHDRRFYAQERRHPGIKAFDAWIEAGGWTTAIRSDRSKRWHAEKSHRKSVPA